MFNFRKILGSIRFSILAAVTLAFLLVPIGAGARMQSSSVSSEVNPSELEMMETNFNAP
jgi:hypothetical protein